MRNFFVSYAHIPRDDDHRAESDDDLVRTFARKLEVEVALRAGDRDGKVGFIDTTNLRAGDAWEPTLARAVATCSVFILLYSPLYFESPWCSAEWQAFELRLAEFRPADPPAPLLIPLFWIPARTVDPRLGRYQLTDTQFGPAYRVHGLRRLVQLRNRDYEAGYYEFVDALANRIVEVSQEYTIPPYPDPMGLMARARQRLAGAADPVVPTQPGVASPQTPDAGPATPDAGPATQPAGSTDGDSGAPAAPRPRPRPILSEYGSDTKTTIPGERSDNGDD